MGTNCAPAWANLTLRAYERTAREKKIPHIKPVTLWRFIDDGMLIHE